MKVSNILTSKGAAVITIQPGKSVRDAVAILAEHQIGVVLVVDSENNIHGILSERDIVRKANVDEQVLSLSVSDVMTKNVITAMPQDDLFSVSRTMTERRIRHLPIVHGGELVGMISIGDIMLAQRNAFLGEVDTLETQLMAEE